jgi:hypothetical protein
VLKHLNQLRRQDVGADLSLPERPFCGGRRSRQLLVVVRPYGRRRRYQLLARARQPPLSWLRTFSAKFARDPVVVGEVVDGLEQVEVAVLVLWDGAGSPRRRKERQGYAEKTGFLRPKLRLPG